MKDQKKIKLALLIAFSILLLATIIISIVLTVRSNYLKDLDDKNNGLEDEIENLPPVLNFNSYIKETR